MDARQEGNWGSCSLFSAFVTPATPRTPAGAGRAGLRVQLEVLYFDHAWSAVAL